MRIYVSADSAMTGNGSRERPFLTIGEAAQIAGPGDEVMIAPGIYREHVMPKRGGTQERPVTYRAVTPRTVTVTGAEIVSAWERVPEEEAQGQRLYRARIPDSAFVSGNPFMTLLSGDWIQMRAPLHTGMVFIDDKPLREVTDRGMLLHPEPDPESYEEEEPAGYFLAEHESDMTVLTASFTAGDPEDHTVEATTRANLFLPAVNGIDHIRISGIVFTKAATQWAPPTAYQDGAVGPHWAKGWIIEDCEVSYSRCAGISLGKYLQPENENKWTHGHVKHGTQTERDAVCQAVNEGWTRERIGSHTVRGCHIHHCGQAGIVGHLGCAFSVIEDNHIHHIGVRRDIMGAEIAGVKFHAAIDTQIVRNHIHHCVRGLWLDWQAQGTRVSANLFHDNMPFGAHPADPAFGEDLFIEVSHGPTIVDNNVLLSAHAAKLATQGAAFVHNLIAGAFTSVGRGTDNGGERFPTPRYTPYHVPHSTKLAGFMTILHGDMRFYNNLFVQRYPLDETGHKVEGTEAGMAAQKDERAVGTKPYDGYPTPETYFAQFSDHESMRYRRDRFYDHLPVTSRGNAYFNGAMPCDTETDAVICGAERVVLDLKDTPDGLQLVTDMYAHLPASSLQTVNTALLGEAFEPEQLFEAPDGSPLTFNTDYHGKHRGVAPVCGPFEAERGNFTEIPLTCRVASPRTPFPEQDPETASGDADFPFSGAGPADGIDRTDALHDDIMEEQEAEPVSANLVLTGCEACSFPVGGELFTVREVYIRGNEVWMTDAHGAPAIGLDCGYGVYKRIDVTDLHAPYVIDVTQDRNLSGIVHTLATMYRILSKNMVQDPETVCARIRDRANTTLNEAGITMRFTPQLLKFIKDKRFITLEEVVDLVSLPEQEVVGEIVESW